MQTNLTGSLRRMQTGCAIYDLVDSSNAFVAENVNDDEVVYSIWICEKNK